MFANARQIVTHFPLVAQNLRCGSGLRHRRELVSGAEDGHACARTRPYDSGADPLLLGSCCGDLGGGGRSECVGVDAHALECPGNSPVLQLRSGAQNVRSEQSAAFGPGVVPGTLEKVVGGGFAPVHPVGASGCGRLASIRSSPAAPSKSPWAPLVKVEASHSN